MSTRERPDAAPARGVNPRFPLFDSLRAIAALCIVAVHLPFAAQMAFNAPLRPYLVQLRVGIAVFFLISGFLLYRPFARARYLGEPSPDRKSYGVRRALRIVPAYWVALPCAVLLLGASGEALTATPVFTPHGVLAYFGFLQIYDSHTLLGGISAAWTLCVEVSFYAMLPIWAMLMRRRRVRSTAGFMRSELLGLGVLFAAGLTWTIVAATHTHVKSAALVDVTLIPTSLYVLPAYLDHFAVGMALAVLSVVVAERPRPPRAVRALDRASWVPPLVTLLALFLMGHLERWFPGSWATQAVAAHELQAVFAVGLLVPAAFGDPDRGLFRRLLANRVLLWLGLVSYGLYLWHAIVLVKLARWGLLEDLGSVKFAIVGVILSIAVAAASFYGIERHALRLGRRLSHRRRSQDADSRARDLRRHERPEPGVP
jgi:peptidoglycan/LPS O-acetylase OafA/YrhL